jgi:hypothetical protein
MRIPVRADASQQLGRYLLVPTAEGPLGLVHSTSLSRQVQQKSGISVEYRWKTPLAHYGVAPARPESPKRVPAGRFLNARPRPLRP